MPPSSHPPSIASASRSSASIACRGAPKSFCRSEWMRSMVVSRGRIGAWRTPRNRRWRQCRHRRCCGCTVRCRHRRPHQGQGAVVRHATGPVRTGVITGRPCSGPSHLRRRLRREIGAGLLRGGRPARRPRSRRCRGCPALDDGVAPVVAGGRGFRIDGDRGPAMAAADGSCRFRTADGVGDAMAGVGSAIGAVACPGRRAGPMVARVDPVPRRRKRGFRSGCV